MWSGSRRQFLRAGAAAAVGLALHRRVATAQAPLGQRPGQDPNLEVLNPRARVPLSFIIDDSTCLVNMGYFCMPQFAEYAPKSEEYKKPWRTWPREIPDAFLRQFGQWCGEHGVKGKWSIVPCPACVGWLDRELPGWSRKDLLGSLKLVRDVMVPNWDLHPEMITHTRVIDLATGRPMAEISSATMENSYPQTKKSVDELAAYLAYALKILKNCDLPCEGITTPGGFGNLVKSELSLAVHQAVRDVYGTELPHYFKYISEGKESTRPRPEHARDLESDDPKATVSVPGGTGDWFGGWSGDREPEGIRYANDDATEGRMVELIEKGEPAPMFCHWPGLYNNGAQTGFEQFKRIILALENRYRDRTIWMKTSELARYYAVAELTTIERSNGQVMLTAPFAGPLFTLRVPGAGKTPPALAHDGQTIPLAEVAAERDLKSGTWLKRPNDRILCFDLPKGRTVLSV